jgi:hypothetical protein
MIMATMANGESSMSLLSVLLNIQDKNCKRTKKRGDFCKKFAQSLDTFGFIYYLCTDISQGRILRGGRAKLGSITFNGGAFVIFW